MRLLQIITSVTLLLFLNSFSIKTDQNEDYSKNKYKVYKNLDKALKKPEKVFSLDLSSQKITELNPEITKLKNLKILRLHDNPLNKIPDLIFQLTRLEGLFMGHCSISEIPKGIANLKRLQVLWLSDNKITSIPTEIGELGELQKLFLLNNNIHWDQYDSIKCLINDNCWVLLSYEFDGKPPHDCK